MQVPGAVRFALVVAAACVLLWRPGLYMDDEVIQAASTTSILEGHLDVRGDLPAGYQPILNDTTLGSWVTPHPGDSPVAPIASTMLSALAAPVVLALRPVAGILGVQWTLAITSAAVLAVGATSLGRLMGRPSVGRTLALIGVVGAAVTPLAFPRSLPASPWLEIAALQAVSIGCHAATAALVLQLLRPVVGERAAWISATLYAAATPLAFWALSAKYHALATLLAVLAFWLLREGLGTPPRRALAGGLVAGLACWNELVLGGFLGVGLAVLLWTSRTRAPSRTEMLPGMPRPARTLAAAAAGFALGFLFFVAQQAILHHEGVQPQFPVFATGGGTPSTPPGTFHTQSLKEVKDQGYLSHTFIANPGGAAAAALQTFVWTWDADQAMSFLSISPFIVLAVVAWSTPAWRVLPRGWGAFLAAYAAILVFFMGDFLVQIGGGYDIRYAATLWPFLVLAAAPAVARLSDGPSLRPLLRLAAGLVAGSIAVVAGLQLFLHATLLDWWTPYNFESEHLVLYRYGGFVLAVVVAWQAWRIRGGRPAPQAATWLAVAVASAVSVQLLLQLTTGRQHEAVATMPGVFAPTEVVSRLVWKALFTFGSFTLP